MSDTSSIRGQIAALTERLKELELSSQNASTATGKSPFAPRPLLTQRSSRSTQPAEAGDQTAGSTTYGAVSRVPGLEMSKFDGSDAEAWLREQQRWMRLTGVIRAPEGTKLDWAVAAATMKVKRLVERLAEEAESFEQFSQKLCEVFPKVENNISLREQRNCLRFPGNQHRATWRR